MEDTDPAPPKRPVLSNAAQTALEAVYQDGYQAGQRAGYDTGYQAALNAVTIQLNKLTEAGSGMLQDLPIDTEIEELDISVRLYNLLKRQRINTIADILATSRQQLLGIQWFGEACATELETKLSAHGYQLSS